jgi:4-carboxymuconolactone decarboxylase
MAKAAAKTAKKPAAKKVAAKAAAKPAAKRAPKRRAEFSSKLFQQGLEVRRAVLGGEYVDNSIANASEFMVDFQKLVTEYCWGDVWTRPGLDRKHRSMLNLAMLTALNRPHELRLHVKGALRNGVTKDEIREVLMQATIYCGVPAAMDSFKVAREVLKEQGL